MSKLGVSQNGLSLLPQVPDAEWACFQPEVGPLPFSMRWLLPAETRLFGGCAQADGRSSLCCLRPRGAQLCLWAHGSCCRSRLTTPGRIVLVQAYSADPHAAPQPGPPPPSNTPTPDGKSAAEVVTNRVTAVLRVTRTLSLFHSYCSLLIKTV